MMKTPEKSANLFVAAVLQFMAAGCCLKIFWEPNLMSIMFPLSWWALSLIHMKIAEQAERIYEIDRDLLQLQKNIQAAMAIEKAFKRK